MSEINNGIPIETDPVVEISAPIQAEPTIQLSATVNMGGRSSEYNAEAWAVGERGGVPVSETDQTYHNNAKYYADATVHEAEAWAVGQRGGEDVGITDPTYHNNAKYYAGKSAEAATEAVQHELGALDARKANADNLYTYRETSGAVATVDDAVAEIVKQLRIEIAPVQDLNGYASPWAGGAGKNLFNNPNPIIDVQIPQGTIIYTKIFGEGDPMELWGETNEGGDITEVRIGYVGNNTLATLTADYNFTKLFFQEGELDILRGREMMISLSEFTDFEPYSNICPITGWTGCNVARRGKNLSNPATIITGNLVNDSGDISSNADHKAQSDFIQVEPLTTYTLSGKNMHTRRSGSSSTSNAFVSVAEYSDNGLQSFISPRTIVSQSDDNSYTFTTSSDTHYIRFSTGIGATDIQFELGSDATPYAEYTGNAVYSISFPDNAGTVYGGMLTINRDGTGELVVDRASFTIDGTETYIDVTSSNAFYLAKEGLALIEKSTEEDKCSIFPVVSATGGADMGNNTVSKVQGSTQQRLYVKSALFAGYTAAQLATYFTSNNMQFCGRLIDPVIYELTVPQVQLFIGKNTLQADTGDILSMKYATLEQRYNKEESDNRYAGIIADSITTPADFASFHDGADNLPMALKIGIKLVQEYSGDPAPGNERPIIGWDGCDLSITQNNLLNPEKRTPYGNDGTAYRWYYNDGYRLKANQPYVFSATSPNQIGLSIHDKYSEDIIVDGNDQLPVTVTKDTIVYFVALRASGISDTDAFQLEFGSTASDYTPYVGNVTHITFPSDAGTVYGGELTINKDGTGTLAVDKAMVLVKDLTWSYQSQYTRFATTCNGIKRGAIRTTQFITSSFVSIDDGRSISDVPNNGIYAAGNNDSVFIKSTDYTSETDFVDAYGLQQIVYPLNAPVPYPLTVPQVRSILGLNTIWADCGTINEVQYSADTKTYIDNLFANILPGTGASF